MQPHLQLLLRFVMDDIRRDGCFILMSRRDIRSLLDPAPDDTIQGLLDIGGAHGALTVGGAPFDQGMLRERKLRSIVTAVDVLAVDRVMVMDQLRVSPADAGFSGAPGGILTVGGRSDDSRASSGNDAMSLLSMLGRRLLHPADLLVVLLLRLGVVAVA